MSKILRWYLQTLEKHPWKTQASTTCLVLTCGDVLAQLAVEKKTLRDYELQRTLRFGGLGLFFVGPLIRTWYLGLERLFGVKGATVGFKKMLTDQIVFAPSFLATFMGLNLLLQKRSVESIKEFYHKEYFDVLKVNYTLWPACQLVTFYLIPFQHRVLFVNSVALVFNTYIAWKVNTSN